MNFLQDLNKDLIVHRMGLYSIKRYAYTKFNYVDADGKTIDEPVYSFILMRGPKWFNSTHMNFRESQLDQVIPAYEKTLADMQQERRERLTMERSIRKQFPVKHEFVFENVTIVAIEKPCYYRNGIPSTSGNYFEPKEKIVEFYANGTPFRSNAHVGICDVVDVDFILNKTIKNDILHHYDKSDFSEKFSKIVTNKLDFPYIPMIAIIGYAYEFKGETYEIYNFRTPFHKNLPYFEVQDGQELEVSLGEFMKEAKPVGELQGMKGWKAILNKVNFC